MNCNVIGWIAAALSVAAFKVAFDFGKSAPIRRRTIGFLVLGLLGAPAILSAIYYVHLLPEWRWFYELRSWRGSELLSIPLGASAGLMATFIPRPLMPLVLVWLVTVTVAAYLKPLLMPLRDGEFRGHWKDNVCLQSNGGTCGPASVATICRHLNVTASEQEIARAAFTCQSGTEAWYLARFVRSKGLIANFDFSPGLPADLPLPAVIGINLGLAGHFIVVLGRDHDVLTIADPLHGIETITLEKLQKRSPLTGFHLSIQQP